MHSREGKRQERRKGGREREGRRKRRRKRRRGRGKRRRKGKKRGGRGGRGRRKSRTFVAEMVQLLFALAYAELFWGRPTGTHVFLMPLCVSEKPGLALPCD